MHVGDGVCFGTEDGGEMVRCEIPACSAVGLSEEGTGKVGVAHRYHEEVGGGGGGLHG